MAFVVLYDANVLYPSTLSDLLIRIASAKIDAQHRREAEGAMPKGLRYVKGWPPRLPTLSEAAAIAKARAPILARHQLANRFPTARAVRDRFADLIDQRRSA